MKITRQQGYHFHVSWFKSRPRTLSEAAAIALTKLHAVEDSLDDILLAAWPYLIYKGTIFP